MIILFTATGTVYAQIYKNNGAEETGKISEQKNISTVHSENNSTNNGFFKSGDATNPGSRPGNGGAIGQEEDVPLKSGLNLLLACSVIFGFVKLYKNKQKHDDKR